VLDQPGTAMVCGGRSVTPGEQWLAQVGFHEQPLHEIGLHGVAGMPDQVLVVGLCHPAESREPAAVGADPAGQELPIGSAWGHAREGRDGGLQGRDEALSLLRAVRRQGGNGRQAGDDQLDDACGQVPVVVEAAHQLEEIEELAAEGWGPEAEQFQVAFGGERGGLPIGAADVDEGAVHVEDDDVRNR
jgi:hypothetical protein